MASTEFAEHRHLPFQMVLTTIRGDSLRGTRSVQVRKVNCRRRLRRVIVLENEYACPAATSPLPFRDAAFDTAQPLAWSRPLPAG